MAITEKSIGRREFLAGAASAIGGGALGLAPVSASATATPSREPGLYYWSGSQFVEVGAASAAAIASESASVSICAIGVSPQMRALDVGMPGGVFHAYTAPPRGGATSQFRVPTQAGNIAFILHSGDGSRTFDLSCNDSSPGRGKLAHGTYVFLDAGVSPNSVTLSDCAELVSHDGLPVSLPHILITVAD